MVVKKLLKTFMNNNCKRQIKQFRVEKVIMKKVDQLYFKWKGYVNLFNGRIDKKDIVIKNESLPRTC